MLLRGFHKAGVEEALELQPDVTGQVASFEGGFTSQQDS